MLNAQAVPVAQLRRLHRVKRLAVTPSLAALNFHAVTLSKWGDSRQWGYHIKYG